VTNTVAVIGGSPPLLQIDAIGPLRTSAEVQVAALQLRHFWHSLKTIISVIYLGDVGEIADRPYFDYYTTDWAP
jgi:hypothetical protein